MTDRLQPPLPVQADAPAPGEVAGSCTITAVFDAPPPDVQALLDSEQGTLPHYFDAQRADALQRSQRDWPELWRLAPAAS